MKSPQLSLAQSQHVLDGVLAQAPGLRTGLRKCLRQGCDRSFRPHHHWDRYCCPFCLEAAKRWQLRFANQRYRRSENGKRQRQEQAKRYRLRVKVRPEQPQPHSSDQDQLETINQDQLEASDVGLATAEGEALIDFGNARVDCEGYAKDEAHEKCACHRPGCYRRFTPPPQSPLKKFCSSSCRQALRRVILRERRWFKLLGWARTRSRDGPRRIA